MKAGYKTTEFWMTAVTSLLALLVTVGWVTQADAQTLQQALAAMVVALGAVITNGVVVWHYINSRTDVKLADVLGGQYVDPANVTLEVVDDAHSQ